MWTVCPVSIINFSINFHWNSILLMMHTRIRCRSEYCVNHFLIGGEQSEQFSMIRNSNWMSWIHSVLRRCVHLNIWLLNPTIFTLNFWTFHSKIKIDWKFHFNEQTTAFSAGTKIRHACLIMCLSRPNCPYFSPILWWCRRQACAFRNVHLTQNDPLISSTWLTITLLFALYVGC